MYKDAQIMGLLLTCALKKQKNKMKTKVLMRDL